MFAIGQFILCIVAGLTARNPGIENRVGADMSVLPTGFWYVLCKTFDPNGVIFMEKSPGRCVPH